MELAALEHLKKLISPCFLGCFSGTFRLLTLWSYLALKKQLLSYLKTIQNILMTLLDGSQVSDRCPLGYLFSKEILRVAKTLTIASGVFG